MSYPYDGSVLGNEMLIMSARGQGPRGMPLSLEDDATKLMHAKVSQFSTEAEYELEEIAGEAERAANRVRRIGENLLQAIS